MGAPAMGMDAPAGSGGRDGWAGDRHSGRKKGVCGEGMTEGRGGQRKGVEGWTDRRLEGLMDTEWGGEWMER